MISEIEMVCSLYHLWYIPTMCIHLLSDGKLLFTGVCRLRISTQDRSVKLNWSAFSSTCGTSWPCAFIYSQRVSYFSLVHAWLAFQHRRMISEIEMVCSLFHLWYIPTMCIYLLSDGKLLSLVRADLEFQRKIDQWNWIGLLSLPLVVHPDHVHSFILRR